MTTVKMTTGSAPAMGGHCRSERARLPLACLPLEGERHDEDVLGAFLGLCNAHRFADLDTVVTRTVTINGRKIGLPDYVAAFNRFATAFPDCRWRLHEVIGNGPHHFAARLGVTATHGGSYRGFTPTGRVVNTRLLAIYRIRTGFIDEIWQSFDVLRLLQQLQPTGPIASRQQAAGTAGHLPDEPGPVRRSGKTAPAPLSGREDEIEWSREQDEIGRLREQIAQLTARQASLPVIEQAKGMMMQNFGLTDVQAFDLLVRISQDTNTKVRNVATQIVSKLTGAVSAQTSRHAAAVLNHLHQSGSDSPDPRSADSPAPRDDTYPPRHEPHNQ